MPHPRFRFRWLAAAILLVIGSARPAPAQPAAAPASAPAVSPAAPAALTPAALAAKIDEYMNAQVQVNSFSGTILLAREGTPLVTKGYGFANLEWRVPNTPDTVFRIGSITKQFTSMVVMQLREQGTLKVEDSVCLYLAPCPEAWKPVTIHHLLTHTSGIPSYTGLPEWRKVNMVPKTVDEMIGFFRDLPLEWQPGTKWAYNNSGYFLLGAVIEKVTGQKYEQVVSERIFKPLGMKDSGYDWTAAIVPRRAAGYMGRGTGILNAAPLDMQQPYAAGALYSTVEDLLKWDQALYTDRLLPAASRQIMWTPVMNDYAYGWSVRSPSAATFGHRQLAHSGGINGFSSMIIRLPDANATAIVLSNNMTANAGAIARDLLAIYFGQAVTVPAARTEARVDPKLFDAYVGRYELGPKFLITIAREGDRLTAQATGQGAFEIFPESETKFFARVADLQITFVRGPAGAVTELILHQGGDRRAKRLPEQPR
jgi:CubicO group peptidase (beta-lactamase class C family)